MLTLINTFDRHGVSEENLHFTILQAAPELSSLSADLNLAIIDGNIDGYPGAAIVQHLRNSGMKGFIVTFSGDRENLAAGTDAGADIAVLKTHDEHIFENVAKTVLARMNGKKLF
jgi:DNA-binding response OmpR family regulator